MEELIQRRCDPETAMAIELATTFGELVMFAKFSRCTRNGRTATISRTYWSIFKRA